MDKKYVAIAIVAVVVILVAVAAVVLMGQNGKGGDNKYDLKDIANAEQNTSITGKEGCYDKFPAVEECNLVIYGNVNNDMDIDNSDMTALKKIIADNSWDKNKNPFADVNCDGKVNNSDVTALQKILNKEKTLLYYVNSNGYPDYIHYPVTGKIGINYDYGYMCAQILGNYDQITAGTARWTQEKVTDTMYPGVHSFYNMGDGKTVEEALAAYQNAGVTVIMGTGSTYDLNVALHESGYGIDCLNLRFDQVINLSYVPPIARLMTAGFIFDEMDNALTFYNWWNNLNNKIETIFDAAGVDKKTFIVPHNTNQAVETSVDDCLANGRTMGDYTNVRDNLPMTPALTPSSEATSPCYNTTIEYLLTVNPDVLIISMWGSLTDATSYDDAYAVFKEKADYFKNFKAYKNGDVYGVCYETFGTYAGVAVLYLLCSYVYPDLFSEEDGWNYVDYYFDNFTLLDKKTDLKNAGGLIVFQLDRTKP